MSSPRRLVRNLVSSASVTAASAASVIAIQAIVSKGYGSRMFGVYTLVLAIARIMLAAADLGVDTFVYREVAQRPERTREWVDTALHLRVRLAVPGIAVGILLFALLGPSSQLATAVVLLADQTLGDASVLLFHVFVAQRDAHLQALLAVPSLAARVVGALLVVRAGGDLVVLAAVLLACHVAQLGCTFLVARARGWAGGPHAVHVRQLVRDAWP
ncbi:MAG TPA: hypothetical protein VLT45_17755, partial [Kofleriaceae bacterium]|nr:hypothetical protein [Kofleriaceae bacterium]